MTEIGHNSVNNEQLSAILGRINKLEDDKKVISDDIRDVYAEAQSAGFNSKALRVIVRRQRADAKKIAELEADVEVYMASLGMI